MPTYEYECTACGLRFERIQAMTDAPISSCPNCQGQVQRLLSGGAGFVLKNSDQSRNRQRAKDCSLEHSGTTCCGRDVRCGKSSCDEN